MIKILLGTYRLRAITAWVMTFFIAAISAVVFSVLGPALHVLLQDDRNAILSLQSLFGEYWGRFYSIVFGVDTLPASLVWTYLPMALLVLAALRAILVCLNWFLWEGLSEQLAARLRAGLIDTYLKWSPDARRQSARYDEQVSTVLSTDIRMIREYIVHFYGGLPREACQFLFFLVVLVLLSPRLTLAFLVFGVPLGLILSHLGKKIKKRSKQALSDYGQLSEWLEQRMSGIETIKHYRSEELELQAMAMELRKMDRSFKRIARTKARSSPLTELLAVMATAVVLYFALQLVALGTVSSSVLLSFLATLGILSQTASKLSRYFNSNREGQAAIERLMDLRQRLEEHLDEDIHRPLTTGASLPADESICLSLSDLSYTYPGTLTKAIDGMSFKFQRHRIYAICGASGAGKSTLFSLILGLRQPQDGTMELFAEPSHPTAGAVGYMPQNVILNSDDIDANVCYPDAQADRQGLERALKAVALDEWVHHKADEVTQANGAPLELSGGQKQRLLLARLFYHHFPLVLIDEGTSALDPESEAIVYQSILALAAAGSCVLVIAHRPSILSIADCLIELKAGCIEKVMQGDQLQAQRQLGRLPLH